MGFPSGEHHRHHHHHHHDGHNRSEEDDPEVYPPPAQAIHEPVTHVAHTSHYPSHFQNRPCMEEYPPPPPPAHSTVHHIYHEEGGDAYHHQGTRINNHLASYFANRPIYRVYTKAGTEYSLAIRHGKVILAPSDARDDAQRWYKDEKHSVRVKDAQGFPSFALVNKATGQAIKHSIGNTHPVQLIQYNPDVFDESVLWTLSADLGDGYRTIRMLNNIALNVDAFHGDKNHGGVHDGTTIVLWEWMKGENQRWMIVPYCQYFNFLLFFLFFITFFGFGVYLYEVWSESC